MYYPQTAKSDDFYSVFDPSRMPVPPLIPAGCTTDQFFWSAMVWEKTPIRLEMFRICGRVELEVCIVISVAELI